MPGFRLPWRAGRDGQPDGLPGFKRWQESGGHGRAAYNSGPEIAAVLYESCKADRRRVSRLRLGYVLPCTASALRRFLVAFDAPRPVVAVLGAGDQLAVCGLCVEYQGIADGDALSVG